MEPMNTDHFLRTDNINHDHIKLLHCIVDYIQWMLLNGITLGQTITDPIIQTLLISQKALTYI
jgi:hypothetical protein